MKSQQLKKIALPDKPGVYRFMKGSEILYIGKATSLKDRVKSYFSSDLIKTRGMLLVDMVARAETVKYIETDSVLEALILEANEIKKHQPYYNTKEKDDKSFNYVCITREELPKVITKRGKDLDKNKYKKVFGPFTSGPQLREALKIIRRVFPFIDEKTKNYYEFYRQLNLAPNLEKKKEYLRNIKHIVLFFEGKKKSLVNNLKKEMNAFAKLHQFEKAGEVKRQIFSIQHINDIALIKEERLQPEQNSSSLYPLYGGSDTTKNSTPTSAFRIEAYDIAHMGGKNMVGVMVVVENGEVNKSEYKKFKIRTQDGANDTGALAEVLERRLAHNEWTMPSLIVVDGGKAQINVVEKILNKYGIKIPVVSVLKDERHKPKDIIGDKATARKYEKEILLANSEAHRFAINYHKNMRNKNFISTSLKLRRTRK